MLFGLNAFTATFQRLVNNILFIVKWQFALVYLDDIAIYSKTPKEL